MQETYSGFFRAKCLYNLICFFLFVFVLSLQDLFYVPTPLVCRGKVGDQGCKTPFISLLSPVLEKMETLDEVDT